MATPAPRKSNDLNAAWATRCEPAAAADPAPTATNIRPYWADVEPARARLASVWSSATTPPEIAVARPMPATTGPNQGTAANSAPRRMSTYTPAATSVAECSRAETGVGPAIAAKSHGENGICADLAAAARTTPAAITETASVLASPSALNAKVPVAAKATPAATNRPMSPSRVVTNTREADPTEVGSVQRWPMRAHEAAATSSQPISRVMKSAAVTSQSMAPTNASSSTISRVRPSRSVDAA